MTPSDSIVEATALRNIYIALKPLDQRRNKSYIHMTSQAEDNINTESTSEFHRPP